MPSTLQRKELMKMEEIKAADIKLEDFAKIVGTTPNNIRGHLKKYAAELAGHIEQRPKRGGTYLDDFAQRFIKGKMRIDTVVLQDNRVNELLEENNQLLHQVNELLIQRTELQLAATEHIKLIESHGELQNQLDEATTTIENLTVQLETETNAAAELRADYNKQKNLILTLTEELEKAAALNDELQTENTELKSRGFFARLFNR